MNGNWQLLQSTPARILTVVLLLQAAAFYGLSREEVIPQSEPLASVPKQFGTWTMHEEGVIEKEIADSLKADELLNRSYINKADPAAAHLFVAYFKSQRTGRTPHSPRNCLPGSGWVSSVSDTVSIPVPGREPIEVNRYIVQKGPAKSLVLYWYQSRDRVVAREYKAKFFAMADALRYNRTDTALVRVVIPLSDENRESAEAAGTNFIQSLFAPLRRHFPA